MEASQTVQIWLGDKLLGECTPLTLQRSKFPRKKKKALKKLGLPYPYHSWEIVKQSKGWVEPKGATHEFLTKI